MRLNLNRMSIHRSPSPTAGPPPECAAKDVANGAVQREGGRRDRRPEAKSRWRRGVDDRLEEGRGWSGRQLRFCVSGVGKMTRIEERWQPGPRAATPTSWSATFSVKAQTNLSMSFLAFRTGGQHAGMERQCKVFCRPSSPPLTRPTGRSPGPLATPTPPSSPCW